MSSNNQECSLSEASGARRSVAVTVVPAVTKVGRSTVLRRVQRSNLDLKNTKAEFRRLKTILPAIKRKENVSKLDIILEAIKYIDDLQDQLIDRLTGPKGEREAALVALTERDMEARRQLQQADRLNLVQHSDEDEMEEDLDDVVDDLEEEDEGVGELHDSSSEDEEMSTSLTSESS